MKRLMNLRQENKKNVLAAAVLIMSALMLSACGGESEDTAEAEPAAAEAAADVRTASEEAYSEEDVESLRETFSEVVYEGTVRAEEAADTESPYYGIMYAGVLEINGRQGDSSTIYSFKDKRDPDNCWSFTGLEIGDIEEELTVGKDVAIMFSGDIIGDMESVEFLVILPDGNYEIKKAEGTAVSNMMSTFTIETDAGEQLSFIKDNCKIDSDALNTDNKDRITVYYADGGELGNYPFRVFKDN